MSAATVQQQAPSITPATNGATDQVAAKSDSETEAGPSILK